MGKTATMVDLTTVLVERQMFTFTDFEPRDVPGFESDIAKVVGCSDNQTGRLLDLVDDLKDDPHYSVVPREVSGPTEGSHEKRYPQMIRVTVSQA